MIKFVAIAAALLSVAPTLCATPGIAVAEDAGVGSIEGKLIGFRRPEDAVVYIENVPGEHPVPEEPVEFAITQPDAFADLDVRTNDGWDA